MDAVLPDPPGLEVENVLYSYRIQKQTGDWVTVYVSNELADGSGYVFRERDDWKPGSLSGTQIIKIVPLGRVHRDLIGDGSIEVVGDGSVYDSSVIYTYRVDPCYDPQASPNCPGFVIPEIDTPEYEAYYAWLNGDADIESSDARYSDEETESESERDAREEEEEAERARRLEEALFEAGRVELFAQAQALDVASPSPSINSYYEKSYDGGVYRESITLRDSKLPNSRRGLRNGLAQQILHQQMVDSQYRTGE